MRTREPRYFAYMLRLWQVKGNGESSWRASLESPRTGERRGFANLEALFEFLQEQTSRQIDSQEEANPDQRQPS